MARTLRNRSSSARRSGRRAGHRRRPSGNRCSDYPRAAPVESGEREALPITWPASITAASSRNTWLRRRSRHVSRFVGVIGPMGPMRRTKSRTSRRRGAGTMASRRGVSPDGSSSSRSARAARRPCRLQSGGRDLRNRTPLVSKGHLMDWVVLIAVIVALLTVDLLLHRGNHEPTAKRALVESAVVGRRAGSASPSSCSLCDGRPGLRRVPERLRDREVAQHRQRVRVGGDLLQRSRSRPATSTACCSGASSARW